jgi:hypothetical protein
MARWKKVPIQAAQGWYAGEQSSYDAQNVLIARHNFPTGVVHTNFDGGETGDFLHSIYADQIWDIWSAAFKKTIKHPTGLRYCPTTQFMAFATEVMKQFGFTRDEPLTGARLVRFSNQGGYEVFRLDGWWKHPDTPTPMTASGIYEGVRRGRFDDPRMDHFFRGDYE